MNPPAESRTVPGPDATVAYRTSGAGAGDGPALVFVHGWGCSSTDWDGLIARLPAGARTVAIDLPGHGGSTTAAPAVSIVSYAEAVAAVLDAEGMTGTVAIGHSLGGSVVLELAIRRPELVSRIVGMDTYHYLQIYPTQSQEEIDAFLGGFRTDRETAVDDLIELSSIPATPGRVKSQVRRATLSAQYPLVLSALEDGLRWDLDAALAASPRPVSAIVAKQLVDPVALERYGDRISFHQVPGVSHYLLLEDPQASADALVSVLNS